ncbi:MAG: hypothetical protein QG623_313 [Patescibacteria group bacterium]|nr:hypothetical protein [Patescibacteria group bacterium]
MTLASPTASIDTYRHTTPTIEDIFQVAEDLRFNLDGERAGHIESIGSYYRNLTLAKESDPWHQGNFPVYREMGLEVGLATVIGDTEYPYVEINFRPKIDGKMQDNRVPPEHRYQMIYNATMALQNYCLLAEAGFTRRPLTFTGLTNIEMANFAKRAGFITTGAKLPSMYGVDAKYQDVLRLIFSEKTSRLIRRIGRLANA